MIALCQRRTLPHGRTHAHWLHLTGSGWEVGGWVNGRWVVGGKSAAPDGQADGQKAAQIDRTKWQGGGGWGLDGQSDSWRGPRTT